MTKEPRTREQLAEMVLKEARATANAPALNRAVELAAVAHGHQCPPPLGRQCQQPTTFLRNGNECAYDARVRSA